MTVALANQNLNDPKLEVLEFSPGFYMRPVDMEHLTRKNLIGARYFVFWIVWEKTIGGKWNKQWDGISNSKFQEELAYSENGIRNALNWLVDNKWLRSRDKENSQLNEYSIHKSRLEEGKYFEFLEWRIAQQCQNDTPPQKLDPTPPETGPTPDLDLDQEKNKNIPLPPSSPDTIVYGNVNKIFPELRDGDGEIISFKKKETISPDDINTLVAEPIKSIDKETFGDPGAARGGVADKFMHYHVSRWYTFYFIRRLSIKTLCEQVHEFEIECTSGSTTRSFAGRFVAQLSEVDQELQAGGE